MASSYPKFTRAEIEQSKIVAKRSHFEAELSKRLFVVVSKLDGLLEIHPLFQYSFGASSKGGFTGTKKK